jgi:hypothetical protein
MSSATCTVSAPTAKQANRAALCVHRGSLSALVRFRPRPQINIPQPGHRHIDLEEALEAKNLLLRATMRRSALLQQLASESIRDCWMATQLALRASYDALEKSSEALRAWGTLAPAGVCGVNDHLRGHAEELPQRRTA